VVRVLLAALTLPWGACSGVGGQPALETSAEHPVPVPLGTPASDDSPADDVPEPPMPPPVTTAPKPPTPEPKPFVPSPADAPFGDPVDLPAGKEWVYVWGDEFDGTELDLTKWSFTPLHWQRRDLNHGADCRRVHWDWTERDNVRVAGGNLVLGNTRVMPPPNETDENGDPVYEGDVLVHASAIYSDRQKKDSHGYERTYGYFEARIRIAPTVDGIHTAFWLYTYRDGGGEVDIAESALASDKYHMAVHWKNEHARRRQATMYAAVPDLHAGQFHVFAVHWDEDGYRFYADGRLQWAYSGPGVSHVDHFIYLSTGASWNDGNACTGTFPNEALVDWVRVWELRGAP